MASLDSLAVYDLLASVSHDLRNPLNTLAMSTGLLRDDLECNSVDVNRALDLVARMERATTRMQALIDDLLEASRIASGNVEICPCHEPALPLVRLAVAAAKSAVGDCELDETTCILVDRTRMIEALGKVLAFAAKITGGAGKVSLGALRTKNEVVLTAHAQHTRGAHAPIMSEGSGGVGLLVARRLIELQGGTFQLDTKDTSLTITMAFPLST
jgi:signal transduction histidine kinase